MGCRLTGTMAGQPFEEFTILGYDSFAKNVVEVSVESVDNQMLLAHGRAAAAGEATTTLYGELDEYTTAVLRQPYKVRLREQSPERHVTEIWGLDAAGAEVKKVEFTFTRSH